MRQALIASPSLASHPCAVPVPACAGMTEFAGMTGAVMFPTPGRRRGLATVVPPYERRVVKILQRAELSRFAKRASTARLRCPRFLIASTIPHGA